MSGPVQHVYWVVNCQTKNCRPMFVSYIGIYDEHRVYGIPSTVPMQFERCCEACGRTHTYNALELRSHPFPSAPAPDWEPSF